MLLCLSFGSSAALAVIDLPVLKQRVTDLTGTLTSEQRQSLEAASAAIEQAKGSQVVVLMLPTTQPETIEQFAIRLADAWRIGRKGVNDGVILIVAKQDRKTRIEVAYGLEGAIPDAVAKRIITEIMTPRFAQGDFAGGLTEAVAALGKIIGGEQLPPPETTTDTSSSDLMLPLVIVVLFGSVLRSMLGLLGSLLVAGVAGWLGWLVFASWFAAGAVATMAFLFSFVQGGIGGWQAGGFSSSGSSGSSDSGFSDGGGSFGGGGASGSW